MLSVEEAKRAVEVLHDKDFMGRHLVVNGAKAKPDESSGPREDSPPREPRERKPAENQTHESKPAENSARETKPSKPRGEKPRGDKRSNSGNNPARLHLDNLSYDVDESALEELFKGIGNVRRVELAYNKQTHKPKGSGVIEMQKADDARRAIEVLHDQPFMGRKLVVTAADEKAKESSSPEASEAKTEATETKPVVATEAPADTATEAPEAKTETKPVETAETADAATETPVKEATEAPAEPVAEEAAAEVKKEETPAPVAE
jgi:RNA recognition motif-containing protein